MKPHEKYPDGRKCCLLLCNRYSTDPYVFMMVKVNITCKRAALMTRRKHRYALSVVEYSSSYLCFHVPGDRPSHICRV